MPRKPPTRKTLGGARRAPAKPKAPRAATKPPGSGKRPAKAAATPTKRAAKAPGPASSTTTPQPRDSKQAQLVASLRPAAGVTLAQMMALTGWQAHSVRGVISAVLRKKLGLNVTCEPAPQGGERLYRIVAAARA